MQRGAEIEVLPEPNHLGSVWWGATIVGAAHCDGCGDVGTEPQGHGDDMQRLEQVVVEQSGHGPSGGQVPAGTGATMSVIRKAGHRWYVARPNPRSRRANWTALGALPSVGRQSPSRPSPPLSWRRRPPGRSSASPMSRRRMSSPKTSLVGDGRRHQGAPPTDRFLSRGSGHQGQDGRVPPQARHRNGCRRRATLEGRGARDFLSANGMAFDSRRLGGKPLGVSRG